MARQPTFCRAALPRHHPPPAGLGELCPQQACPLLLADRTLLARVGVAGEHRQPAVQLSELARAGVHRVDRRARQVE
eukprot:4949173-Prymnesium_polylepis.1